MTCSPMQNRFTLHGVRREAPAPRRAAAAAALAAAACLAAPAGANGQMKVYETPYYFIHTDLGREQAREAAVRMTAMAEEYHRRTKGFAGAIRKKLPFYLFRSGKDYYAAGGMPASTGVYKGNKLMAIAGGRAPGRTWHTVQHEGFHQFADHVICGKIPVWVNEGLAEYFGQAVFTGDGFVVGVVPPHRLRRVKAAIEAGAFKPLRKMMQLSYKEWTRSLVIANYDQAWSMIHFLVHGDGGKYVGALNGFMNDISLRRMRYEHAWVKNFGRDLDAFQKRYRHYWLALPPDPTAELYHQAVFATVTSFYARAYSQRQRFETAEAFFAAAEGDRLKISPKDWLPPALLAANLPKARKLGRWAIEDAPPRLTCLTGDGQKLVGTFNFRNGLVRSVRVRVAGADESPASGPAATRPASRPAGPPASDPASQPSGPADPLAKAIGLAWTYAATGKTERARRMLAEAIKNHPRSPHVAKARRLLDEIDKQTGNSQ